MVHFLYSLQIICILWKPEKPKQDRYSFFSSKNLSFQTGWVYLDSRFREKDKETGKLQRDQYNKNRNVSVLFYH